MMKAAASKKYRRLAREAVEAECVESIPWSKAKVMASFYHKTDRRRDPDNATGSLKAVYDGIVDASVVSDDDHKHMRRGEPEFNLDHIHPRVVLTIERIE